jgi:hypothetical protein
VPDQSMSYGRSGQPQEQAQTPGNPADTSANTPEAATQESQESNVTRASEGEKVQTRANVESAPVVSSDDYEDENKWPYRRLQQEAKNKGIDGGGKREEIIARLRGQAPASGEQETPRHLQDVETMDADTSGQPETPRGEVPEDQSPQGGNIGFGQTGRGQEQAELLQGLSNERRAAQLSAVRERSARSGDSDRDENTE